MNLNDLLAFISEYLKGRGVPVQLAQPGAIAAGGLGLLGLTLANPALGFLLLSLLGFGLSFGPYISQLLRGKKSHEVILQMDKEGELEPIRNKLQRIYGRKFTNKDIANFLDKAAKQVQERGMTIDQAVMSVINEDTGLLTHLQAYKQGPLFKPALGASITGWGISRYADISRRFPAISPTRRLGMVLGEALRGGRFQYEPVIQNPQQFVSNLLGINVTEEEARRILGRLGQIRELRGPLNRRLLSRILRGYQPQVIESMIEHLRTSQLPQEYRNVLGELENISRLLQRPRRGTEAQLLHQLIRTGGEGLLPRLRRIALEHRIRIPELTRLSRQIYRPGITTLGAGGQLTAQQIAQRLEQIIPNIRMQLGRQARVSESEALRYLSEQIRREPFRFRAPRFEWNIRGRLRGLGLPLATLGVGLIADIFRRKGQEKALSKLLYESEPIRGFLHG